MPQYYYLSVYVITHILHWDVFLRAWEYVCPLKLLMSECWHLCLMAISESWLHKAETNQSVEIDNFNVVRADRVPGVGDRNIRGGVAIYLNKHFKHKILLESMQKLSRFLLHRFSRHWNFHAHFKNVFSLHLQSKQTHQFGLANFLIQ